MSGNRLSRLVAMMEDGLLVLLLSVMILVAAAQILLRNVFDIGLSWGDQTLRILVLWVALMGAVAASRENKHINIDVLLRFLSSQGRAVSQVVVGLFTSFVCGVVAFYAGRFVYLDYEAGAKVYGSLPVWIVETILPAGFAMIAVRYLIYASAQFKDFIAGEGKS